MASASSSASAKPAGDVRSRRKRLRRRQRLLRRRPREARAPERCEHRVRASVAGPDSQRVGEQVGLRDDPRIDATRVQHGLERSVVGELVGLQTARPHDRAGPGLLRQCGDDVHGVAPFDDQPRSQASQVGLEAAQGVPEPPARRAAGRPGAILARLPREDGEEAAAALARLLGSGEQRWVVAEPQVAAQPEDRRGRVRRRLVVRRGSSGRRALTGAPPVSRASRAVAS